MKDNTSKKKRALKLSAPFLFVFLGIVLISLVVLLIFTHTNIYYQVITNLPETANVDVQEFDEITRQALVENNEGMDIAADFANIAIRQQWATITIESAGVYDIPVYNSTDSDILMQGIGHHTNSRFPGQGGRIVLAGHVGISRFFQRLETMQVGDTVTLNTIYGDYVYRVKETAVVDETDGKRIRPMEDESEDELVCYTCYPYNTTSVRTQRFLIICEKVSGKDWRQEEQ